MPCSSASRAVSTVPATAQRLRKRQDRRQRQAEPSDRRRIEPLLEHAGHIAAVMRELEPASRRRLRHEFLRRHGSSPVSRRQASSRANFGIGNRCDAGSGVT